MRNLIIIHLVNVYCDIYIYRYYIYIYCNIYVIYYTLMYGRDLYVGTFQEPGPQLVCTSHKLGPRLTNTGLSIQFI